MSDTTFETSLFISGAVSEFRQSNLDNSPSRSNEKIRISMGALARVTVVKEHEEFDVLLLNEYRLRPNANKTPRAEYGLIGGGVKFRPDTMAHFMQNRKIETSTPEQPEYNKFRFGNIESTKVARIFLASLTGNYVEVEESLLGEFKDELTQEMSWISSICNLSHPIENYDGPLPERKDLRFARVKLFPLQRSGDRQLSSRLLFCFDVKIPEKLQDYILQNSQIVESSGGQQIDTPFLLLGKKDKDQLKQQFEGVSGESIRIPNSNFGNQTTEVCISQLVKLLR